MDDIIGGYKDRLIAGDGSDRLFLSAGEFQGGGDNLATGGAGADQFWLANAQFAGTVNTITDFTVGEDILGIAGVGLTFADLSIAASEENANNTVIATADQDLAILLGIQPDTISETDFTFSESAV
jgi:Ca2+-binding RTX toxin-like protein